MMIEAAQLKNTLNDYIPMLLFFFTGFELPLNDLPEREDFGCLGIKFSEIFIEQYQDGFMELVFFYNKTQPVNESYCDDLEETVKDVPLEDITFDRAVNEFQEISEQVEVDLPEFDLESILESLNASRKPQDDDDEEFDDIIVDTSKNKKKTASSKGEL